MFVFIIAIISFTVLSYYSTNVKIRKSSTIIMIPIYGQSLALGEEAQLVTNIDSLNILYKNKVLSANLDNKLGFFSNTMFKQNMKRILNIKNRFFEISGYGLAEFTANRWIHNNSPDSLVSIFCEGQGNTSINSLGSNSNPYKKLMIEIKNAYDLAIKRGCKLVVPAFCWLQGENDITHNTGNGYKQKLQQFRNQLDKDVKQITHQKENVKCILYQSCCLSLSEDKFNKQNYICPQMDVPQAQMELVRDDENFSASGPTYPYSVVREYVHLDGVSQKRMGYLEGISLEKILRRTKNKGVTPSQLSVSGNSIEITFNVENPPLCFDTVQVNHVSNDGFSVINKTNINILRSVLLLSSNKVLLICFSSPKGCQVRYGVNGEYWKSGNRHGPRGNLRDSQGDKYKCTILDQTYRIDNWGYMFVKNL